MSTMRHINSSVRDLTFEGNYSVIDGIRLHYLDEGSGPPILMVHGQPT